MKNNISPNIRPIDEITYEFPNQSMKLSPKFLLGQLSPAVRFRKISSTNQHGSRHLQKCLLKDIHMVTFNKC